MAQQHEHTQPEPDGSVYWAEPLETVSARLSTGPEGLSGPEARSRLARYGPNAPKAARRATALGLLLAQFRSPLVLLLIVATGVSAVLGEWTDASITLGIILISTLLSFSQEYRASRALETLRERVHVQARVVRDGTPQDVPATAVVPGDLILLSAGSLIAADAVLIEAHDFFVNEAILTGETFPVEKRPGIAPPDSSLSARTNCVYQGTSVRTGSARALVVQTGARTEFGRVAQRLELRPPETEFERGIRSFGTMITQITLLLVLGVFALNVLLDKPAIESLLFSIALAVGMAPEMLPAIVSITLSSGARMMAARGVIVRRLAAIENFGSMDVFCTDKTGTLTEGVVRLDGALDPTGQASGTTGWLAALNAHFQTGLVNPLDEAILASPHASFETAQKLDEIPYDFVRKRLSVVVQLEPAAQAGLASSPSVPSDEALLITKGAFERVLDVCSSARTATGSADIGPLRAELEGRYTAWSTHGFRVLGLASRPVTAQDEPYGVEDERNLCFEGFLLFFDPPKPGARQSIADLAVLGVQLKIITGDNALVARHTAEQVGLEADRVCTGAQLQGISDEALWHLAERTTLFAEVDPTQKERIILALKKTGHVVGYMGDGINDAPALHAADVGLSVDSAVDVAKEAADFVLLERDLGVLRAGIELGRRTFANTLKYVFYTTSANFGNMFSMAGTAVFLPFLPLLPKQILLNNLLSDLPSMAIVTDNVDEEFVRRPHRWNVDFIRRFMIVFGLISSVFDYLTFAVLLLVVRAAPPEFRTVWFLESLLTELFVTLIMRTERTPFTTSRPSTALSVATWAVAALAVALPFTPVAGLLGFVPLPWTLVAVLAVITVSYVIVTDQAKRVFYRRVSL